VTQKITPKNSLRKSSGFTIIEVLISLAILLIAVTILSSTVIGSVRTDRNSGQRTQAVQFLNYIGRYAVEGNSKVIPVAPATTVNLAYGTFGATFPEILDQGGFSDPDFYNATISQGAAISLSGMTGRRYDITVCWRDGSGESCVAGTTVGPTASNTTIVN
jgi:prepilin-type N-terminal cleavage/methylation domain-containing protein